MSTPVPEVPDPTRGLRGVFAAVLVLEAIVVGLALGLQAATIACGLLVPALAVVGLIFTAAWTAILLMARDVRRKYARGELPAQVAAREAARKPDDE